VSIRAQIRGFTLLELLVVLAVGALLVGLSEPLYSRVVPGARVKSQARDLIVALRDSANKAVSSGRETQVRFDTRQRSYTVGGSQIVRLTDDVQFSVRPSLDLHSEPFTRSDADETVTLRFFPDGSSTGATISLAYASRDYLIGVDWLTGRVELLEMSL